MRISSLRGGLLVLTNERLLFVNHRVVLPGVAVKRFPLSAIRGHTVVTRKKYARLTLWFDATGWNSRRVFDSVEPRERALSIDKELSAREAT